MGLSKLSSIHTGSNGEGKSYLIFDAERKQVFVTAESLNFYNMYNEKIQSVHFAINSSYQEMFLFHDSKADILSKLNLFPNNDSSSLYLSPLDAKNNFWGTFTRIDIAPKARGYVNLDTSWHNGGVTSIYLRDTRRYNEVRIPLASTVILNQIVLRFTLEFLIKLIPKGPFSGDHSLIGGPTYTWYPNPSPKKHPGLLSQYQYICLSQKFRVATAFGAFKNIEITMFIRVYEEQGRLRMTYDLHYYRSLSPSGFADDDVRNGVNAFMKNEQGTINSFFNLITSFIPTKIKGLYLLPGYAIRNRLSDGRTAFGFEHFDDESSEVTIVLEDPENSDIPLIQDIPMVLNEAQRWFNDL